MVKLFFLEINIIMEIKSFPYRVSNMLYDNRLTIINTLKVFQKENLAHLIISLSV